MSDPLPALRAAVAALLAARGEAELGGVVARAGLELAGPGERWSMGSREVVATRLALVVEPAAFAALSADPARFSTVRDAFAGAVRTPDTELADLALVLRLPGLERGWHRAYRDAPEPPPPERPDLAAVLGGAAALLEAAGDEPGAAALRRASLEAAAVPSAGPTPLLRYVLRLEPADRVAADRDRDLAERLRRAVHEAGNRAAEAVAGVELAAALRPLGAPGSPEARLAAALAARGAIALPVARGGGRVALAVVAGGELRRVDIIAGPATGDLAWRAETVRAIEVSRDSLEGPGAAEAIAALLCEGAEV